MSRKKKLQKKIAVAVSVVNLLNMSTPLVLPYVNVAGQVPAAGGQIVQFADTAQSVLYGTAQAAEYTVPPDSTIETMNDGDTMNINDGGNGTVTTMSGGEQYVSSGGTGTVETMSNGFQYVYSGGTGTVNEMSGGAQNVFDGGNGTVTNMNSGGVQNVSSGGTGTVTHMFNGGTQKIVTGGKGTINFMHNGGKQEILKGGTGTIETMSNGTHTVSSGGTGTVTTMSGGQQYIKDGGTGTVSAMSGGTQTVSSGGVGTVSSLQSGGTQIVYNGGTSLNTHVMSGGMIKEEGNGGTVTNQIFEAGGIHYLANGATKSELTVSGHILQVGDGGTAISTTVNNGGTAQVSAGGAMSNTSVNSGGVQDVLSGGTAISTTVNNGGTAQVLSGGEMSNTTVNGGGVQDVLSGGTAISTTVNDGGTAQVLAGGTMSNTTVSGSNATQNVNSGGRASNITVGSGGMQVVFDGGLADHTTVATSGSQVVSGGRVTSTHVESNAAQHVYGGTVISTTLGESGACQNLSGGVASGTIISDAGASQNINAGATASNTIISSGKQEVFNGGVASATTVSGGTQNILNSGTATDTILSGGNQVVNDGGTVTDTHVKGNANQYIYGGVVSGTVLDEDYAAQTVSGGTVTGTTINGGGTQHVSGGTVTNTIVNSEGMQIVSGGTVTDTHVKGNANQYVYGGVVSGTTLDEGDACQTLSGGTTVGTIIHARDAHQIINAGAMADHTILSGGDQLINAGGTAIDTTIKSGGNQIAEAGGILAGTQTIEAGGVASGGTLTGTQDVAGMATDITVSGTQNIKNGGTAVRTTVNGGTQSVLSGGTATDTTLKNKGKQIVSSGGVASGGTFSGVNTNTRGYQEVYEGGTVVGAILSSYGNQTVTGGMARDTTVTSGGIQAITSSGVSLNATIKSGGTQSATEGGILAGTQTIEAGASASGGTLKEITVDGAIYKGVQNVNSGGTANNITVTGGGTQFVLSGGTANGVTLDGGTLSMAGGAIASGTAGGHGRVVYDGGSGQIPLGGTNNFSSFTVSGGTLETQNGFHIDSSGGITVNSGGTLIAGGAVTVQTSGSSLTVSGGGTLSATTISTENGGEISMSGGVLQAAGDIAIRHALTNAYGNVSAGGTLTVGGGATQPGSGKQLNLSAGRDIHISGAATVTNLSAGENISAGGQAVSATNISAGGAIAAGSITAVNISAGGNISASANISADSISAGGTLSAGGNLTAGTLALSAVPASGAAVSAIGDVNITNLNVSSFNPAQNTNGSLISAGGTVSAMNVNGKSLTAGGTVDTNVKQAQPKAGIDTTYDSLTVSLSGTNSLTYDAHNTYTDIAFSTVPWNTGSAYYEAAASNRFSSNTSISAEKLSFTFEESQKASLTSGSTTTLFANATGLPAGMPVNYGSGKKNVAQTIEYKVPNGAALTGTLTGTVNTIAATAATSAIQYTADSMTLDSVDLAGWDGATASRVPAGWTLSKDGNGNVTATIETDGMSVPEVEAGKHKDILQSDTDNFFAGVQINGANAYKTAEFTETDGGITFTGSQSRGVTLNTEKKHIIYAVGTKNVSTAALTGEIVWNKGGVYYKNTKYRFNTDAVTSLKGLTFAAATADPRGQSMTLIGGDVAGTVTGAPESFGVSVDQANTTLAATASGSASVENSSVKYAVTGVTLDKVTVKGAGGTADKVPEQWTLSKDGNGNVTATIETDGMSVPTVVLGKHIDILQSDTDNFFAGAAINGAYAYKATPFTEQDTAQSVTLAGDQGKGVTLNSEKNHIIYAVIKKDVNTVTLGRVNFVKDTTLLDRSGAEYNYAKVTTFGTDGFTVAYAAPETVTAGESMTLLKANATLKDMAAQVKETAYSFAPLSGVTIDANITGRLTTNKGIVTYTPSANQATKLTFGNVVWKDSGALMTRPANITFAGADVDTSKINFTNVTSLEANQKMTLVSDFGNSVGTIIGTKYKVGTGLEGEGEASLTGSDLIFTTKTGANNLAAQEQTHKTVMAMEAGMALLAAGSEHVGNAMDGLGLAANAGADGTSTAASVGGGASHYETGSHVKSHTWNAAVAVGRNNETKKGSLEYGIFGEYGKSSYTLHSDAGRGDGDGHYAGGGLLARWTNKHNVYTEASFRLGRMSDTASDILHDAAGNGYGYDVHANYFGAHVGIGQLTNYRNGRRLDVYGKYFYTRREGVSFDAGADHYDLDSVSSSLLRIGARYGTTVKRWNWYGGLAFEYEFDGKSEGTVSTIGNSAAIRAASVKGGSVRGEIGLRMDATKDNPWKADIAIYGYGGKHRGFGGNVTVAYTF